MRIFTSMPSIQHYIQEIGKLLSMLSESRQVHDDLEDQLTVIKRVFRSQIDNDTELSPHERAELCKIMDYQTDQVFESIPDLQYLPTGTIIYAKKDQTIWTKRKSTSHLGVWESEERTMNVQDQDVRENHYFEILYVPHSQQSG
ncbi:MAG: hypothetical protein NW226_25575 [Microscillaceae bacterium]|nr:hypothetical protein [Microscillaceae bacterium]